MVDPLIDSEFLTAKQVGGMLDYTPRYVRRLARTRQIPALKVRRRWIFPRQRILEWIHQGCPSQDEQPNLFDRAAAPS